jgi:hypothetical protein
LAAEDAEGWSIEKGELLAKRSGDPQSIMCFGDDDWIDYTITFELQGLEGQGLAVVLRHHLKQLERRDPEGRGVVTQLPAEWFTDRARWYKIEVAVDGAELKVIVDGAVVEERRVAIKPGRMALLLAGEQCRIRGLKVRVLS